MKFKFKSLLVAVAFIATNAANAASGYDWSVTSGSAAIAFSSNGIGAVSGIGTLITTPYTIPFKRGLPDGGEINTAKYEKTITTINLALSGGTTAGDSLASVQAADSFVQFKRATLDENDEFDDHSVFLTNLDIDLATSTVYANVYTWYQHTPSSAFSEAVGLGKLAVFRFDKAGTEGHIMVDTVPGQDVATGHASSSSTDSLRLNVDVADLFLTGLGLDPASREEYSQQIRLRSWGTLSVNAHLSGITAVPEPSACVLVGMGLLALCAAKRRSRPSS